MIHFVVFDTRKASSLELALIKLISSSQIFVVALEKNKVRKINQDYGQY